MKQVDFVYRMRTETRSVFSNLETFLKHPAEMLTELNTLSIPRELSMLNATILKIIVEDKRVVPQNTSFSVCLKQELYGSYDFLFRIEIFVCCSPGNRQVFFAHRQTFIPNYEPSGIFNGTQIYLQIFCGNFRKKTSINDSNRIHLWIQTLVLMCIVDLVR